LKERKDLVSRKIEEEQVEWDGGGIGAEGEEKEGISFEVPCSL
jgi:hypothetical protein